MPTTCINSAGIQYIRDHLAHLPRPDREAARAIQSWITSNNLTLDADQLDIVTLHYHPDGPNGYQAVIANRLSLTEAVLSNWQGESNNDVFGSLFSTPWAGAFPNGSVRIVEQLPEADLIHYGAPFLVFNGFFRRTEPARYDASTHVQFPAEDFQLFIEKLDFDHHYKATLDTYWHDHLQGHRLSAKLNFVAACNKQVAEGSLSEAARKLVWRVAGLSPRGRKLRLSTLSVYGYAATDLLYINDVGSDLTVLYMPGNSSPLLEFASQTLLKDWVGQQCQDPRKRQALKQHFNMADGPDGLDFSGLDTALAGLGDYPAVHRLPPERPGFTTDGRWAPRDYVNYRPRKYNPKLTGDVFQALAERQRARSFADAEFIITSNSEVTKARWRGYLTSTLNLLTPLAFVMPELGVLLALGGIAQMGLGLDQTINGKNADEQADGVGNVIYGLFSATPLAVEGLAKRGALFRVQSEGFVPPLRINEQWGYPLGPIDPPRLPQLDIAPYFHSPNRILPLENSDIAVANAVKRRPRYSRSLDRLSGVYEPQPGYGINLELVYDMEFDLFLDATTENEVQPSYFTVNTESHTLQRANPQTRAVTNQMRTATLRALGIDMPLPAQLPVLTQDIRPIPKTITSLWVGDKVINSELLANLAQNVDRLKNSAYQYRLYLSKLNPSAYAENVRQLSAQVPGLTVLPLEEQPFFSAFEQSKNFDQYQAALDGNGGVATNYASASDVLRFSMLHHEGGLYMDVDDLLLEAGAADPACAASQPVCVNEAIDEVVLTTTEAGLLLHPPMSNERLGMNQLFNNSMIGSHPGNPTLIAIADEMHGRYQSTSDFYHYKPSQADDPKGFAEYAHRLSWLTGPAMLTDIVDRLLPDLGRLRQFRNLYTMPRTKSWLYLDLDAWKLAEHELLPLDRFAKVGGQHSWAHT
ncbi:mannosyltransferase [Pseudomonas sp. V1]|uniref:dermonecrotic toxin domain-containing protein n=1 Tax=Pseudomonas arcuscaelestis TaxID=2710591 RepID=UPI00193F2013|nr:DUF6543 domain-containing protein [Pseudomonas arcuscaelestis]MBM3108481.1 mannosyltransferase [Pseudomonas arcuscaelestis]